MPELRLEKVCAGYGPVQVLRDISIQIPAGRRVALIGSNGAGKSTLVRVINGLIPTTEGDVTWNGRSIRRERAHERTRAGIGTVAEGRLLFPECTVSENLLAASTFGAARETREHSLDQALELFPRLRERFHQRAGSLSGGEQQMLAIARALMTRPSLLILDEPSIGLSPKIVGEIFEILSKLSGLGLSLLLVEQNVDLSLANVDYAYVVQQGRIALQGEPAELKGNDLVRRAYLGQ